MTETLLERTIKEASHVVAGSCYEKEMSVKRKQDLEEIEDEVFN